MLSAPPGTQFVRSIGAGAVFDVAVVRLRDGILAIAKRGSPRLSASGLGERALAREAELLRRMRDPCLPVLLAHGEDAHGAFVVESHVPGRTFRELRRDGSAGGGWEAIAASASASLARLQAGDPGFVHADLSPDNLVADADGRVSIVDFSCSSATGLAPVFPDARGTLPYVAPEIARGEARPDAAGDTYALAATLAWLAVGPLTEAAGGAPLVAEVGDKGLRLERLDGLAHVSPGGAEALRDALRFERRGRTASARALSLRLAARH